MKTEVTKKVSTSVLATSSNISKKPLTLVRGFLIIISFLIVTESLSAVTYQETDVFIEEVLGKKNVHSPKKIWLTGKHKENSKAILGHEYGKLRQHYWTHGDTCVWILDEIGKERPITVGIITRNGELIQVKILDYRESRGGEIRHEYFIGQLRGLKLNDKMRLSGDVDGISGATLSVRAVTKLSRLALYFDACVRKAHNK